MSARQPGRRTVFAAGVAVAAGTLVLYLATSSHDLVFGDSPELTGAAVTLGVAHPPGYPLWTVFAHLFTLFPLDTYSFRVSAFSAVAGAAAVFATYLAAYVLTRSVLAAAVAGILLGLTPVVWSWSIVPEVFALHAALAGTLVALLYVWHRTERWTWFVAAAFVGGLGLANQQTIILVGPAVLLLMWRHRVALLRDGLLWKGVLALVAGLLPYLYLPFVAAGRPAWNYGDIQSAGDLIAHVLRTDLGSGQLVSRSLQGGSPIDRLLLFAQSFDLGSAVLILAGLASLYRRDRALFWFACIGAASAGPAFVLYANVDVAIPVLRSVAERFFILPHVLLAPVVAEGVVWAGSWQARRRQPQAALAVGLAALVAAVILAGLNAAHIDRRDDHAARHFAEDILATTPQGRILLASGDASIWPIAYLRTVEAARPDLTFIQTPLLTFDWYVRQLRREHPELVLRASRYDGRLGTSRDLIEANGADRIEIEGGLLDDSLAGVYRSYRRGLLTEVRLVGSPIDVAAMAAENDRLLRTYRIPSTGAAAGGRWEQLILADYAFVAFDVAQAYETSGAVAQARTWYMRALSIDPGLAEARAALARLPKAP